MNRHLIKMKHPASWHTDSWNIAVRENQSPDNGAWRDALRIGNGLSGALLCGAIAEETIQFTRHNLWHHGDPGNEIPDVSHAFRQMRTLIGEGKYHEANTNLFMKALQKEGYTATPHVPYPLGTLKCSYPPASMFKGYERGINMRTGEAFVRFRIADTAFERKAFVSRDADIIVISIKSEEPFTTGYQFALLENTDAIHRISPAEIHSCTADGTVGAKIWFTGDITTHTANHQLYVTGKEYLILVQLYVLKTPEDQSTSADAVH